jgi:RNA recognition motif-containing protein
MFSKERKRGNMAKNVYVGNLSFDTSQDKLRELFEAHGQVATVNVITDRYTGRPRGFAFVEMMNDQGANAAIAALNGQEVDGRALTVAPAKPRQSRSPDRGRRDSRRW